jgi:nucleotide-binding universal stress UspA family protein
MRLIYDARNALQLSLRSSHDSGKGCSGCTRGGDLVYRKILVPIDFSEHSKKTVSYATAFASRYNATVQLLHVFEVPDDAAPLYGGRSQTCNQMKSQVDAAEEEARENLTAFENQLLNAGVKVEAYVRVGFPFDEIVQMASYFDVDLIIVGISRLNRDDSFAPWQHCGTSSGASTVPGTCS